MTPTQRDHEKGAEVQHRLAAAAKAYAADPTNMTRFDELMAAGAAFGQRNDLEWAADLAELAEARDELVDVLKAMVNDCDRPYESCVRCAAAEKALAKAGKTA